MHVKVFAVAVFNLMVWDHTWRFDNLGFLFWVLLGISLYNMDGLFG